MLPPTCCFTRGDKDPAARLLGAISHLRPAKYYPHSIQNWPTAVATVCTLTDQPQTSQRHPSSLALSPVSALFLPAHQLLPGCWCLNPFPALQRFKTLLMGWAWWWCLSVACVDKIPLQHRPSFTLSASLVYPRIWDKGVKQPDLYKSDSWGRNLV